MVIYMIMVWIGLRIFYRVVYVKARATFFGALCLKQNDFIFSQAGHCDPKGGGSFGDETSGPCCSPAGECGNSTMHCDSDGSVNFGQFGQN